MIILYIAYKLIRLTKDLNLLRFKRAEPSLTYVNVMPPFTNNNSRMAERTINTRLTARARGWKSNKV